MYLWYYSCVSLGNLTLYRQPASWARSTLWIKWSVDKGYQTAHTVTCPKLLLFAQANVRDYNASPLNTLVPLFKKRTPVQSSQASKIFDSAVLKQLAFCIYHWVYCQITDLSTLLQKKTVIKQKEGYWTPNMYFPHLAWRRQSRNSNQEIQALWVILVTYEETEMGLIFTPP